MSRDDLELGEDDRALLALIAQLTVDEDRMPQSVADAAKALHDWADADARLAEMTADAVPTRGDGAAYSFTFDSVRLRAEVEPAGYRRRRLVLVAHDEDAAAAAEEISVQFPDGATVTVAPDRFGERITQVPAGSVRMVAVFPSGAVTTPWFTV
ncbi:MAG: hypothetical protein U0Q21_15820 [Dermatophilaceae bacterium]